MPISADLLFPGDALLGEGPLWDAQAGVLRWVDSFSERLYAARLGDTAVESMLVPGPIGSINLRAGGGLVAAISGGIAALDPCDGTTRMLGVADLKVPACRLNDSACDAAGRLWAGGATVRRIPHDAALFRFDAEHRSTTVLDGVTTGNGMGWSPDGRTMYFTDTGESSIFAFDFDVDSGALRNRRVFISTPREIGRPDGMAVDAEGCVWTALCWGSAVHRYAPDGRLIDTVAVPVSLATSVAFAGPGLDHLVITTGTLNPDATARITAEELALQPHAGSVFVCTPGVCGLPVAAYAG